MFPELRERIEQLGLEFFDVDLSWGVPAKDINGETANSWKYCRQWIDRYVPKEVWRQVLNADHDTDPRYTDKSLPIPRELSEQIVALAKPLTQPPD